MPFVKAISGLLKVGTETEDIFKEGLKVVIGCGDKISFWENAWCDIGSLRERFPRIMALFSFKCGTIDQFGFWYGEE